MISLNAETMAVLLAASIKAHVPSDKQALISVQYKPRCSHLFAARKGGKGGVVVETSLKLSDPRFTALTKRAAVACLEIIEDRTSAVMIMEEVDRGKR